MPKKSGPSASPRPANLSAEQIKKALKKITRRLGELDAVKIERWDDDVQNELDGLQKKIDDTLVDIFGLESLEYQRHEIIPFHYAVPIVMGGVPTHEWVEAYEKAIKEAASRLRTVEDILREKLDDLDEDEINGPVAPKKSANQGTPNRRVFVVHGHDEEAKQSVARFLQQIELDPIILHEQANKGRTIIEKFEDHSDVGFAVIILTPDDVGSAKGKEEKRAPRARQNVILELGYFVGALGRARICALKKGEIEVPSDYVGVIYTSMDAAGAWKTELAKEIDSAGIEINFRKAAMA